MADNEAAGKSFSELLFNEANVGLDIDGCYNYTTSFSTDYPPNLLCFGDTQSSVFKKSSLDESKFACNDSDNLSRKRNGSVNDSSAGEKAPISFPVNIKRTKSERSNITGHGKGKREKLGERITALQQLVSPYGKSDTASVLHEAMGYIKFLQDQVQVLCSPYLQAGNEIDAEKMRNDLRSMGLCLVPVECTSILANDNGADFWSPAMTKNLSLK